MAPATALLLLLACCASPSAEDGSLGSARVCSQPGDCPPGHACTTAGCRDRCAIDAECRADRSDDIEPGRCHRGTGTCSSSSCEYDFDCGDAERCEAGWCVPEPPGQTCTPRQASCDGVDLVLCNVDGTEALRIPCDPQHPCLEGPMGPRCGDMQCTPSAVGCRDERTVFGCDEEGRAMVRSLCPGSQVCARGRCLTRVCRPRSIRCSGLAQVTCNEEGTDYALLDCRDSPACESGTGTCICYQGRCLSRSCVPDSSVCVGAMVRRLCAPDGSGHHFEKCALDQACVEGACLPVVCEPGERGCQGDRLVVCNASGTGREATDCLAQAGFCEALDGPARCRPQVCEPLSSRCVLGETAVERCTANGSTLEQIFCGEWGCADGVCLPEPIPEGWVRVEPGTFLMGSPEGEPGRQEYEIQHPVELTRPFYLQETEVTQAQWVGLMGENPSYFADCGPDCPVECVSFYDALAYANERSELEGLEPCYALRRCAGTPGGGCAGAYLCEGDFVCREVELEGLDCEGYRLPTEAEWEYAARAGTQTAYYAGPIAAVESEPVDPVLDQIGWYAGNSEGTTHPVAQKAPNPWGLYDMSGNVYELVWDRFSIGYARLDPVDPVNSEEGENQVYRGGSWYGEAHRARSAYRHNLGRRQRVNSFGFRLARTAPSEASP